MIRSPRLLLCLSALACAAGSAHADEVRSGVRFTPAEARRVLELVNAASLEALDHDVGLRSTAARAIVAARPIDSLVRLDAVSYVGPAALRTLRDHAPPASPTPALPPGPTPPPDAPSLTLGAAATGTLRSGEVAWFTVRVEAGRSYGLTLALDPPASGGLIPSAPVACDVALQSAGAGATATSSAGSAVTTHSGNSARLTVTAPSSRVYQVRVGPPSGPCAYRLTAASLDPIDAHGDDWRTATPLRAGQTERGRIELGDQDCFAIYMAAGVDYTLRVVPVLADPGGPRLTLLAADGQTAQDSVAAGEPLRVRPAQARTHLFRVDGGYGRYALETEHGAGHRLGYPRLLEATLHDTDGSLTTSQGDTLRLVFDDLLRDPGPLDHDALTATLLLKGDESAYSTRARWPIDTRLEWGAEPGVLLVHLGTNPSLALTSTAADFPQLAPFPRPTQLRVHSPYDSGGAKLRSLGSALPAADVTVDLVPATPAGFYPAAPLAQARGSHTATLLDDGRLLVVGGLTAADTLASSAEVYEHGVWTTLPAALPAVDAAGRPTTVAGGRYDHTATMLDDGRVLIAGGFGFDRLDAQGHPVYEALRSAWLFDPQTDTFEPAPAALLFPRRGHVALALSSGPRRGQVLFYGGHADPRTELFDPQSDTFTRYVDVPSRPGATAVEVGHRVLFLGGPAPGCRELNLYDDRERTLPLQNSGDGMPLSLAFHQTVVTARGRVVSVGGLYGIKDSYLAPGGPADPIRLYSVGDRAGWGNRLIRVGHQAVAFGPSDGGVLLVGGVQIDESGPEVGIDSFYAVRATGAWRHAELLMANWTHPENWRRAHRERYPLIQPRSGHTATRLRDGRVLVVGGWHGGQRLDGFDGQALAACEAFVRP